MFKGYKWKYSYNEWLDGELEIIMDIYECICM